MPNKKITVVGDGAEEPLTPEEEHRIEIRVDQMLDPAIPDSAAATSEPATTPEPAAETPRPSTPTVTKIVTTFADDDDEPATAPTVATPPPPAPEPAKPVAKKITIRHHDDEPAAAPAKAEKAKPAKKKPVAKKPAKKVAVSHADDDTKDESLESKADQIAALALAAEEQLSKPKAATRVAVTFDDDEPAEPAAAAVAETEPTVSPEPAEAVETEPVVEDARDDAPGAPPLIQKHSTAPISEDAPTDEPAEVPVPVPSVSKKIAITEEDSPATDIEVAEEPAAETPPLAPVAQPTTAPAPAPQPPASPAAAVAKPTEADKKYRPPEGPLQFKRAAVPIQPHKPGEPRAAEIAADITSEDAALAQAFEAAPAKQRRSAPRLSLRAATKLLLVLVAIVLLGSAAAVAAVPSLRTRALDKLGITAPKSTVVSAPKTTTTPAVKETTPAVSASVAPDIFVLKEAGIYNVYRIASTGQDKKLLLAGTGKETTDVALAPNASGSVAALVSTRDGTRNSGGGLQQSVTLISAADGATTVTDHADQIKLIDWYGDTLVYVTLNTSVSTTDPSRYQIIAYNSASKQRTVLDHMTYLNDVMSAGGIVYYAAAATTSSGGMFAKISPDGSNKVIILNTEIAAITRVSYKELMLSGVSKWYSYELGAAQAVATNNSAPDSGRRYVDSPDGTKSAYLTATPAQLVIYDNKTGKETVLSKDASLGKPVRWLSGSTLAYQSKSGADYAIKLGTTTPTKIVDVTAVPGISLWHEQ